MNNYNMSTEGQSIELDCYYDLNLAQMYFDDFKDGLDGNPVKFFGRKDNDYCVIGNVVENHYKKSELIKMKKSDLFELCNDYELLGCGISEYSKSELVGELLSITHEVYYEYLYKNTSWYDLPYDFISMGYSQGQVVRILILDSVEYKPTKEDIANILWDCPIHCRIKIDDVEIWGDELLEDCYSYHRDKIIEKIKQLDITQYSKNWLCQNMPSELQYI